MAVLFLDPRSRVVGMAHIALPESKIDTAKSVVMPAYFVDTGIPHLVDLMKKLGAGPPTEYIVKLVGGANVINANDYFQIGKRNITAIKKELWKLDMSIKSEDLEGNQSRTVSVEVKTGKVWISAPNGEKWKI